MNYDKITKDEFDRILYTCLNEETLESIVNIPDVYEIVSKHFNNNTLFYKETPQLIINIPGIYEIVSKYFNNDIVEI